MFVITDDFVSNLISFFKKNQNIRIGHLLTCNEKEFLNARAIFNNVRFKLYVYSVKESKNTSERYVNRLGFKLEKQSYSEVLNAIDILCDEFNIPCELDFPVVDSSGFYHNIEELRSDLKVNIIIQKATDKKYNLTFYLD